ncbi:MAG: lambda exonuclease family protein [Polynucleobacter sp.]
MIQGSAEWFQARCASLTGSRMYEACAKSKRGEYYASREALLTEKLIERLTGQPAEHYVSDAMQWGNMYESEARGIYQINMGVLVEECAYFPHPSIAHSGASPDGLVGEDGVLEIKCPTTKVHLDTLLVGVVPEQHTYQMAWEIESAGRQWADFVSYDPRLPGNLSFFCIRYEPTEDFRAYLRAEAVKFLAELDELEARVRAYRA